MKKAEYSARRSGRILAFACVLSAALACGYLVKTWPDNLAGRIVYRLLGKPVPGKRNEELRHIRQFLYAKRLIDKKDYGKARNALEDLRGKVSSNFLFFSEIYLYLGYVYDITRDFRSEESLYKELEKKDIVFSRFMFGLYHVRNGRRGKGRTFLSEALLLDNKSHRLRKEYRAIVLKVLNEKI